MEQQETKDRFLFMKKTKFLIEINKKIETKWKEKIPVEKDKIPVKNARNILIGEILFCMWDTNPKVNQGLYSSGFSSISEWIPVFA